MLPSPRLAITGLAAFLAASAVQAQNSPHIGYVYPAGGRQGATLQLAVGGQYLAGVTNVHVSGSGVQAAVLEYVRPLTQKEFTILRDKMRELQDKRAAASKSGKPRPRAAESQKSTNQAPATWTAQDEQMMAEIRKKLANPPNRQGNPAIAETASIRVTLSPDAEPGEREIRLGTPAGLSNPMAFWIGQLPEYTEREAKNSAAPAEMNVALPAIVNGRIMPGDADRFRFGAQKGQQVVVAVSARQLIPYLPDAVPGWFQATVALSDSKGTELVYADDYRFNPDPVFQFEIPRDGEYVLEIRDSIYRGREDFVYRIILGELPFITSIFPLGGRVGAPATVEIKGWNLPVSALKPETKEPGTQFLSVRKGDHVSNRVPFAVDTLPEGLEQEPNNQEPQAQSITLPIILNGRVDQPGDWDLFRFDGRAGQQIVAEVYARRLNSPLDSLLKLTDATGKPLAVNDDHEDKGAGLTTHHADSRISFILPSDGPCCLHLGDAQHKGGLEYAYRLRLSPPRPDFELRVVPSSINARAGTAVPITVYALRQDGFAEDITLALKDAPDGFALSGGWVPGQQNQVRLTLSVPSSPPQDSFTLSMEGRAKIQGREVVRRAVPAEDMMQAFFYRHLVPAQDLRVAVMGRGRARGPVKILSSSPVRIPAGGTARVRIAAPVGPLTSQLQLELSEPPEGITLGAVNPVREGTELVLRSDAAKVKPGLKGNLIVQAFAGGGSAASKPRAQANSRRGSLATLPAIPFEIVAP